MLTCGRALGNYIINLASCGYVSGKEEYMHRAVEALVSACELTELHSIVQVKDGDKIVEINEKKKVGKITSSSDKDGIVKVTGDATYAYDGLLSKAIRNVIFVRKSPCGPYLFFRDDMQLANGHKGNYTAQYITSPRNMMTQQDNNVVITGGNRSGKALIVTYTGDKSLRLYEHIYSKDRPLHVLTHVHSRFWIFSEK